MKKNIGNALALYPTPLVVVGAMVNGKPNWTLVGHLGILGHDHVMVSMVAAHYSNQGIRETKALSINIVDEALLPRADRSGCVSGNKEDKSELFPWSVGENGAPILNEAPVSMACTVEDVYETPGFESFICKIAATYADDLNIGHILHFFVENECHECIPLKCKSVSGPRVLPPKWAHWSVNFLHITDY